MSSSVKRLTCSDRFDHKIRALVTSKRNDYGKGLNWKAKKWSVADFVTVVGVAVELEGKTESDVNSI
jgi:hypothetical protein